MTERVGFTVILTSLLIILALLLYGYIVWRPRAKAARAQLNVQDGARRIVERSREHLHATVEDDYVPWREQQELKELIPLIRDVNLRLALERLLLTFRTYDAAVQDSLFIELALRRARAGDAPTVDYFIDSPASEPSSGQDDIAALERQSDWANARREVLLSKMRGQHAVVLGILDRNKRA